MQHLLGWISVDSIKKNFDRTMQPDRMPFGTTLKCVFKTADPPYFNVL